MIQIRKLVEEPRGTASVAPLQTGWVETTHSLDAAAALMVKEADVAAVSPVLVAERV